MTRDWRPTATLEALAARAGLLASIRRFFAERGVLEVDTPVLAAAPPSEAQLACFSVDAAQAYLVPSPEHALKRLLAAGSGPVYQLGHVFRASESGRWHNPEFTMLEWYRPDWPMAALIAETDEFLIRVAGARPLVRTTFATLFADATGLDAHQAPAVELAGYARNAGLAPQHVAAVDEDSRVFWLDLIMSTRVTSALGFDAPICVEAFPSDDAVLVAPRDEDPSVSQRFEIYWHGQELANGAQELTDPVLARQRMQREREKRAAAGLPVPPIDEWLLAAMADGLPACSGVALGVDRLLAVQRGARTLAEVLPFAWQRR